MCLLYNKDLLKKAEVVPGSIKSLEAFIEALEAVEEKTGARGIGLVGADSNDVSWMVNQFVYGFGSSLVSGDGKTVEFNNEKSKAALDFYKNILGKHAQPTWTGDTGEEVMKYFRNQEVAFEIQGIWGVTDIQKNGSPFEVGVISMKDIGLCAEVGPMMLAIPSGMSGEKKEEAVSFIRYMVSRDAQEQILNGEYSPEHDAYYPFRTPIRIDMSDSRIVKSNPEYGLFIEGFGNPSIDVPVPAWEAVKDDYYESGLNKVMSGEMTIDAFLVMIETEGNRILNAQ
jgi:multiple sugar transport system substrate-binding protein